MIASLRYGADKALDLDISASRLVACCGIPGAAPLADVTAATAAVLAAPLEFPPLAQAVVPGDRVVLALDHDVARGREILAALFQCLVGQGVSPGDITVLTVADKRTLAEPEGLLPPAYRGAATVEIHDPDARDRLSYLAVGSDDEPIYLNRLLCDADVVVPIGCLRCEPTLDYHGVYGGLFPTFSGRAAQDKLFADVSSHAERVEARSRKRIDEVGWLLGVQFTVQVVPGPAGELLQVLAGAPNEVIRQGQAICQRAWSFTAPRRASLVVAAIDGAADEQTWDNVARALASALRLVAADGAIALCTTLSDSPGPTLREANAEIDPAEALRALRKRRVADSLPAVALVEALSQARVYLLSELDDAAIEELGITPLANPTELSRLVSQQPSCILLSNAQFAVATVDGE